MGSGTYSCSEQTVGLSHNPIGSRNHKIECFSILFPWAVVKNVAVKLNSEWSENDRHTNDNYIFFNKN